MKLHPPELRSPVPSRYFTVGGLLFSVISGIAFGLCCLGVARLFSDSSLIHALALFFGSIFATAALGIIVHMAIRAKIEW